MRVVTVLTPIALSAPQGNAVTVERVVAGLRERGVTARVHDLSSQTEQAIEAAVEREAPALVHAFHARRTGPLGLRLARRLDVPLVVTLTGTDANHDLRDPEHASTVRRVLAAAAAITVFHASIGDSVVDVVPEVRERIRVVPQAVRAMPVVPFDLGARWALPADRVLFTMPGGIRPVKAPRAALGAFDAVVAEEPRVRLLYVGPVLDRAEGEALACALQGRPWARHVGEVARAAMPSLLAQTDVVLNCSVSEGGMANSLLEAMAAGRAVLASDIPGNRAVVEHEATGLLFAGADELRAAALRLTREPALRARLGAAARARVDRDFPLSREIDGYLAVYRDLTVAPIA